jgi:protein O-GlcNAc transferase
MDSKTRQYKTPFIKVNGPLASTPVSRSSKLQEAIELHRQGQLDQAKIIYKRILDVDPTNADALHLLGVVACQKGHHQLAFDFITKAIEANPKHEVYHSNLGIALNGLKKLDDALASFDEAIAINPSYAEAYSNRGITLKELKQLHAAVSSYEKAISLAPNYVEA